MELSPAPRIALLRKQSPPSAKIESVSKVDDPGPAAASAGPFYPPAPAKCEANFVFAGEPSLAPRIALADGRKRHLPHSKIRVEGRRSCPAAAEPFVGSAVATELPNRWIAGRVSSHPNGYPLQRPASGAVVVIGRPSMRTLAFGHHEDRAPSHEYAAQPRGRNGTIREELEFGKE
jgi:hypothetical protein